MSTAGKVLTILTILAGLGWLFVESLVADLDNNWSERVALLEKEASGLQVDLAKVKSEHQAILAQILAKQDENDRDLTVLRSRLSMLDKLESEGQESINRAKLQIASVQEATTAARTSADTRTQELAQTGKDLAEAKVLVEKLQQEVDGKFAELDRLRQSFIATLEQNRKMLDQLRGDSSLTSAPGTIRPASIRTELP